MKEKTLRKREKTKADDLRPEYDLTSLLKGGVQGKHAGQYAAGTNLVLLEPEIHTEFKTGKDVNDALRLVIELRRIGDRKPGVRKPSLR